MGIVSITVKCQLIFSYRGNVLGSRIVLEGTLITDLAGNYLCPGFVIRMLFVHTLMFSAITVLCILCLDSSDRISHQFILNAWVTLKQIGNRLWFRDIIGMFLQTNLRR